jgi:excinuclease UvrABC ATPase subunit
MSKAFIRVVGARQHNLKNLSLEIPAGLVIDSCVTESDLADVE